MSKQKQEERWIKEISSKLVGKKIVKVEYMQESEMAESDWYDSPICILLDDGAWLIPMRDDEGNDGGSMMTTYEDLPVIPVLK